MFPSPGAVVAFAVLVIAVLVVAVTSVVGTRIDLAVYRLGNHIPTPGIDAFASDAAIRATLPELEPATADNVVALR